MKSLPSNAIHSILVVRRHQEANGGHRCLTAFIVHNSPFVRLSVVQQSTFVSSVDCDLEERRG